MKKKWKEPSKRTARINIRCTEEEKKIINKYVEEQKTTISNYILSVIKQSNTVTSTALMADKIKMVEIMNRMYREVRKSGDKRLIAFMETLLNQMGEEDEIRKSH